VLMTASLHRNTILCRNEPTTTWSLSIFSHPNCERPWASLRVLTLAINRRRRAVDRPRGEEYRDVVRELLRFTKKHRSTRSLC